MNINQLIITSTTVKELNKIYKTNISIEQSKIKNACKRRMFMGQSEVLSKTTRDAVKKAMDTLSLGGEDMVYTAILLCGFDNGYPKNEEMVSRIFSNKYNIACIVSQGILKLQGVTLQPQVQVYASATSQLNAECLEDIEQ